MTLISLSKIQYNFINILYFAIVLWIFGNSIILTSKSWSERVNLLLKNMPGVLKELQSCPTLCDPMKCSPPGSSVHGTLQARILEWVAVPSSRASSWPGDQTCVSYNYLHLAGGFFTTSATWEAQNKLGFTAKRIRFKDIQNKLVVTSGKREMRRGKKGKAVKRYKLLCIK